MLFVQADSEAAAVTAVELEADDFLGASRIDCWNLMLCVQADSKTAAVKAVELDAAVGGKSACVQREAQGHESDLFLSFFRPCLVPISGSHGTPSADASPTSPNLYQVKGRRFPHVRLVRCQ